MSLQPYPYELAFGYEKGQGVFENISFVREIMFIRGALT